MAMCFHRFAFLFWFLLHHHSLARSLDCKSKQCQNTIIDCLPNEDCFISCTDAQSCSRSIINCPSNGKCDVYCGGIQSCEETIINATLSTNNLNIFCEQSTDIDHCKDIKVYGSILHANSSNIQIKCDGINACSNAEIHCAQYANCNMSCKQDTSCQQLHVMGPIEGELNIDCNGTHSCFGSIFNGSTASELRVTASFLLNLSIFCPTNCFLQDKYKYLYTKKYNDFNNSITIYAINGWNDVHMHSHEAVAFEGKMFCGEKYSISCNISSSLHSCANIDDLCNNPNLIWNATKTTNYVDTTETLVDQLYPTNMYSMNIIIVFTIGALSTVISFIFCIKCTRKWVLRKTADDKDVTVFDLIARSILNAKVDESDREFESENDFTHKKASIDPLEISSIISPRFGRQTSGTNTFLSNPISEIESSRCITTGHKISDVSVENAHAPPVYNNTSITPRAPPSPRRNKWEIHLSPLSSNNGDEDGLADGSEIKFNV